MEERENNASLLIGHVTPEKRLVGMGREAAILGAKFSLRGNTFGGRDLDILVDKGKGNNAIMLMLLFKFALGKGK